MARVLVVALLVTSACGRRGFELAERFVDASIEDLCADGCSWHTGEYGACADSCTSGVQMRAVECRNAAGITVPDIGCSDEKPADTLECAVTSCSWLAGAWDACPVACGGGMQQRTVECRTNTGALAPDAHCTGSKPLAAQACNPQACCRDLVYPDHELPGDGARACNTNIRYMVNPDDISMSRRCVEIGYAYYGNYNMVFPQVDWCDYCNARTKYFDGSAWVVNGCNQGVRVLRCCNNP